MDNHVVRCTAFEGNRRIACGDLVQVISEVKKVIDRGKREPVLIFDDLTSELIEVDFRGTVKDVLERLEHKNAGKDDACTAGKDCKTPRGPGRPRLGVISREVTLLPRHWDWLNSQPGGASVALRKLVEEARRDRSGRDRVRRSQEVSYRFMYAMAGNLPGFEEASRALFAGNRERFNDLSASWPADIRDHARMLSDPSFA